MAGSRKEQNTQRLWAILKDKNFGCPMAVILRLEMGMPFAILDWPMSLLVGLAFVFVNMVTERMYEQSTLIRSRLRLLLLSSFLNSFALTVGNIILGPIFYAHDGKRFFFDSGRAKVNLLLFLIATSVMFGWRLLYALLEYYVFPLMESRKNAHSNKD